MKRTSLAQFLFATSVLCLAGLPAFAQEDARPQLPPEERLQERRLQEENLQEQRPEEERLQDLRLQEERFHEERLRNPRDEHRVIGGTPLGQKKQLPAPPYPFKRMFTHGRLKDADARMEEILGLSATATTLPFWNYSVVDPVDTNTYKGVMVGRSPFFHGHRATSTRVILIPVKLTFMNGGLTFDPTTNDGCSPLGTTPVMSLVQNSPIFQNSPYTMNGVNVGTTQYVDAFERANFWSDVSGTPYQTLLGSVTTLSAVSVTVPTASGSTAAGLCGNYGVIDINWWDPALNGGTGDGEAGVILASVAAQGVGPTVLPIFVFDSVFMYIGTTANCCILGYHNAFFTGGGAGPVQTYSVVSWDDSLVFDGDISVTSHEVAEWMDDPLGTNPTPLWGMIGQVTGCQNNLEVGDPLSGTLFTPVTLAGFAYNPQELAFFSWFYGQSPSLGAGGDYSNNISFKGFAKPCPPGGTN